MATEIRLRAYFDPQALYRIGLKAINAIRERTQKGIGADGRAWQGYSEKPFARPLAGITGKAQKSLGKRLHIFTTKRGALWAIIEGGYKAYKRAAYPQDGGTVNLTVSGGMLGALAVVGTDPATNTVRVGFSRQDAAELALYHNVLGAGRSRVLHRFLGLTDAELQRIAEEEAGGLVLINV
jgi:hypothetical protein